MNDGNKISEMNRKFGKGDTLVFESGRGGFCVAKIRNYFAEAVVNLHGGHVMSFKPHGHEDVLWMSRKSYFEAGKPIRGGIPVCWPWFGAHPHDSGKPSHGFARLSDWEVQSSELLKNGATRLTLSIQSDKIFQTFPDNSFKLEIAVTVSDRLEVELIASNRGEKTISCTAALHSYFNVSSISAIEVEGLDSCEYISTVGGNKVLKKQEGNIRFDSETDRIYLNAVAECSIIDPGFKRRIRIAKSGSRTTVVWNPWIAKSAKMPDFGDDEYKDMVCVETSNTIEDAVEIAPGKSHSLKAVISMEALGNLQELG